MLLSRRQKYLAGLLEQFGGLRMEQVRRLMRLQFPGELVRMEKLVRQLECMGLARRGEGVLAGAGLCADTRLMDALDVMLVFADQGIAMFRRGVPPFLLTFCKERKGQTWRYDVYYLEPGGEIQAGAALEDIPGKYRTIIFLAESPQQLESLCFPFDYCLAVKQGHQIKFYR